LRGRPATDSASPDVLSAEDADSDGFRVTNSGCLVNSKADVDEHSYRSPLDADAVPFCDTDPDDRTRRRDA
jgi:hypothetical protein